MKKRLTLFFTALAMVSMCLGACNVKSHNSTNNVPEWSIHEDGHLYHFDEDLGNVRGEDGVDGAKGDQGDKGDKGDTGEQGPKGDTGDTGAQGPAGDQGPKGDDGAQGEPGVAGNGIASVSLSNDGFNDTHTLHFTDGSSYSFKTYNPATALEVVHNRSELDDNNELVDLPYYLGTSMKLDISVSATFLNGDAREIDNYVAVGFNTETAGKKNIVVSFGPAEEAFSVDVIDIADEIADCLDVDYPGLSDKVPGYAGAGVHDYMYLVGYQILLAELDDGIELEDAITAYGAQLSSSGWSGADTSFISPSGELSVELSSYYGLVRVDITVASEFPLDDANAFLSTYNVGFSFSAADAAAFGRDFYQVESSTNSGYHYFAIIVLGQDRADAWKAILDPIVTAAGFEWDDTYGYVNWTTYKQVSVDFDADYNMSYIQIWE